MCETVYSPQEILRRGEASTVFAHAAACRTCRNTLLQERAYPPGCDDPRVGFEVAVHLDALVEGDVAGELLDHTRSCAACAIELNEARAALAELATPRRTTASDESEHGPGRPSEHHHPRITFPRWLLGLLLVITASASERAPQRLLALRESPLEIPILHG